MARLSAGDMAALGALVQRYQDRVLSLSYRFLGDWHKAEDVTQEVFLRVRQAARKYQPQAKFTTWLYRIVYNLSVDQQRRVARDAGSLQAVEAERLEAASDESVERAELATRVRAGEKDMVLLGATGTGKSATTAWRIEGDRFSIAVEVPPNTDADVFLPGRDGESVQVGSGRHTWQYDIDSEKLGNTGR